MMYKRILSGLAAFLMLFGTAAYLPYDTFSGGIAKASAYEFEFGTDDSDTPEGYTLFKQSELDLILGEEKEWGGMEETESFHYCEDWDKVDEMQEVYVRALIMDIPEGVDVTKIYSTVFAMSGMDESEWNWKDSGNVYFKEDGSLEFHAKISRGLFSSYPEDEPMLHNMGLQFKLDPDAEGSYSPDDPKDVKIYYQVFTVGSGIEEIDPNEGERSLAGGLMELNLTAPEYGSIGGDYELPINSWESFYSLRRVHVRAKIEELDSELDYSDLSANIATMDSGFNNYCSSEPVTFDENGTVDFYVDTDDQVFFPLDGYDDGIHFRLYVLLAEDKFSLVSEETPRKVNISFEVLCDGDPQQGFFLGEEDLNFDMELMEQDEPVHIAHSFPVNTWDMFYSLGSVHISARIDELDDCLDYSDIVAYLETVDCEEEMVCTSEPVEFNDQGELELNIPCDPEVFHALYESGEFMDLNICFELKKSAESKLPAEGIASAKIHFRADTEFSGDNGNSDDDPNFNDYFEGALVKFISGEPIDLMYDQYDERGFFSEKKIFSADSWEDVYALGRACLQITKISHGFTYSNTDPDFEPDFDQVRYVLIARSADEGAVPTMIEFDADQDNIENDYIFTADAETLNPNGYKSFDGLYVALIDNNLTTEQAASTMPEFCAGYRFIQLINYEDLYEFEVIDEDSGNIRITGMNKDYDLSDIVIPNWIGDNYVSEIGAEAFKGMDLENVQIDSNIEKIGDRAFEGNPKMTNLHISNTECELGEYSVGYIDDETVDDRFVIRGEFGSTAETYAKENALEFDGYSPWTDLGYHQKELCSINEVLYSDSRMRDNSIARLNEFDSAYFYFDEHTWSDLEALKKIYLSGYIHTVCEDLDYSDFYAAFFTEDNKGNISVGTKFDFDDEGNLRVCEDVSKELFGVGENENIREAGLIYGLKETSYDKTDLTDQHRMLASIQFVAEFNDKEYSIDPDFTFPDVEADLRDDAFSFNMVIVKDPESLDEYDQGRASFFTAPDWKYENIYREQYWAVQAYLTYLDNGIKPSDLMLSIYCIDNETKELTDLYTAPFGENGYAIVDGDIGYDVLKKKANETVGEFGYRIFAKDSALEALDDDMRIYADFTTRIFNKDSIPSSEDGKLVKVINSDEVPVKNIFRGSYNRLKTKKHIKITGKINHLPAGLTANDINAYLTVKTDDENYEDSDVIFVTTPDDEGNIVIETDITDEIFNNHPSASKIVNLEFNTAENFDPDNYEGFDYIIYNFTVEFEEDSHDEEIGDYTLEVYPDGTASVKQYSGNETELDIPAEIGGYQITEISRGAFTLSDLTKVTIPEGVVYIGDYAFNICKELVEVNLPESLEYIGEEAFCNTGITSITVPGKVTAIGEFAFANCSNLTTVSLPNGVTDIGNYAFASNPSLKNINIPTSLKHISFGLFSNSGLEEIVLPDNIESVGDSAFYNCSELRKVTLSEEVYEIWDNAFAECTSLESFNIPDRLDQIRNCVFEGSGLKNIVIPARVSLIQSNAFNQCRQLESIVILNENATIEETPFYDEESDDMITVHITGGDALIRCYEGSAAETYAQENGLNFKAIYKDDGGFDAPEYEWNEDNTSVTATAYCYLDPAETVTETVSTTVKTAAPTCVAAGYTEYTATFKSNKFAKQTKTINGSPATGIHTEGDPVIENDDPATGEYDLVVYCTECHEEISRTHITPEVKTRQIGDINGDGKITADDAIIVARLAAGYGDYGTRYSSKVADINNDGKVTADDAIIIARFAAGYGDYSTRYYRTIPENEI